MRLSLRAKGVVAILGLLLYIGSMSLMMSTQRRHLLVVAQDLERAYIVENALARTSYAIAHSLLKVQEEFVGPRVDAIAADEVALDVEMIDAGLRVLAEGHRNVPAYRTELARDMDELRSAPSRAGLLKLQESERRLYQHVHKMVYQTEETKRRLWDSYRNTYDSMTIIAMTMGLLGATGFAAMVTLFFNRMVRDIRTVQARALEIVQGYRGEPLEMTRGDEIGGMMQAVNRMQHELRKHERQTEISREQRFHQEKMAAVGAVAAAIAHEINNPIAAIAGIAESMRDRRPRNAGDPRERCGREAEMILQQSRRIGLISRQIAELTRPVPQEPTLLDLNGLVRQTCNFIRYDKRFDGVNLNLELEPDLPAITAVADHLTQVTVNLLINAADALEHCHDRVRSVRMVTALAGESISLSVIDNGQGMDEFVLAHAFDESFTTKPAAKGRGLGLFLCRALIEEAGGGIELVSTRGTGTRASVYLPLVAQPATEPT